MPHPLFGADHWSRAARPPESPHELKLRVQVDQHQNAASRFVSREGGRKPPLHRRLSDWLPRFGAWIRDIPLP